MDPINRRQLLQSLTAAGAVAVGGPTFLRAAQADRDRIKVENQHEGTLDWQLTYTRVDPKTKYRSNMIEGYVSHQSIRAGEKLSFVVSTDPPSPFVIDLYRL